ncbi:MAG TPA: ABC transporter permease [Puia sp.]|nr:ABC transporter permease [Puia sp.]
MMFRDIVALAYRSVRGNKLRTVITVAIIAFGIMALVGINTAIEALKQKFTESFAAMGANGFTIHYENLNFFQGRRQQARKQKKGERKEKKSDFSKEITKTEAEAFKHDFLFPATISLNLDGVNNAIVSMGSKKTNPTVLVNGGDENYPELNGFKIIAGRGLNELDIQSGRNVCIIGSELVKKFFGGDPEKSIERIIKVNNLPYRIIGAFDSKGASIGRNWDNSVLTSYNNIRRFFNSNHASFVIEVKVKEVSVVDEAIGEAEGTFRPIRRLNTTEANNFVIDKSDKLVEEILTNLGFITWSAVIIGIITLAGAAIGLMNIMLVAVTERTKEIGLVKAIGGRQSSVRRQFLFESIIISLLGALFGIVLGIAIGNVFSIFLHTSFVLPWIWVVLGIVICSLVGLLAGLYPSLKASRLNPIEALRYE